MSVVTFALYAVDKVAAKRNASRISENALLAFGLLCGWPGAVLAQQLLRHKSAKLSFRHVFWLTVLANVIAFGWAASPFGRQMFRW
ncbi:MAG TPA: DUF1294 domain-containing protein [Burkholderiales bacterium]|nr:DUF1294 domain-containing protein [Burkholderiales bacterium]